MTTQMNLNFYLFNNANFITMIILKIKKKWIRATNLCNCTARLNFNRVTENRFLFYILFYDYLEEIFLFK